VLKKEAHVTKKECQIEAEFQNRLDKFKELKRINEDKELRLQIFIDEENQRKAAAAAVAAAAVAATAEKLLFETPPQTQARSLHQ